MLNPCGPGDLFCFPDGGTASREFTFPDVELLPAEDFLFRRLLGGLAVSVTKEIKTTKSSQGSRSKQQQDNALLQRSNQQLTMDQMAHKNNNNRLDI